MATLFFHKQRKTYYTRAYIPRKLRCLLRSRVELWRSLDTADADVAALRSAQWDARLHKVFLTLKREGRYMTQAQIDALVERWLESALEEAEDYRATCGPLSDQQWEDQIDGLSVHFDAMNEALLSCDYRRVERQADELLKSAGLSALDHNGAEFGRLCRRLLQANIEYTRIEQKRWEGSEPYTRPEIRSRVSSSKTPERPVAPPVKSGPLFSVVVEKYFSENPRPDRTSKPMRVEFAKFAEIVGGDRPITSITKEDARRYKEHLLTERKSPQNPDQGLSLLTVLKHLSCLSVVFKWAEANGYIPDNSNPTKGLAPSKKAVRNALRKRRPFTNEELVQVFGSSEFKAQQEAQPERYWVPLICLFHLCRREEASQLAVADIQEEDGIPFMQIKMDERLNQGVKNESSQRRIPIHSSLIQLGFLDYVAKIKAANHAMLFPGLTKGHNGFGDPLGKWFGRLIRKCGVTDPRVVLHSSRHGISALHNAGCPHHVAEVLTGHAAATIHDRVYGHREMMKLSVLREGLEKLRYDEVVKALLTGEVSGNQRVRLGLDKRA